MPEPPYYLGAAPTSQVHVPTLTREEGIRRFLENPPYARYEGWNLITLERAELLAGRRIAELGLPRLAAIRVELEQRAHERLEVRNRHGL